ncbi:MAG: glycosyltransferase [Terracidiphilus sp.]
MKIAIVHPWFLELGGAEKVVDALASIYLTADIFTLSADPELLSPSLKKRKIYTSGLDRVMRCGYKYKRTCLMPLFPVAVESFDVSQYDLVISCCGPAVMGVNPSQDAVHVSYVHTPQRAWWDLYSFRQARMSFVTRSIFVPAATHIRMFEFNAMQRVDHVVSNSNYIAKRVSKYFRRDSTVIYPPVDTSRGYLSTIHDDYYLSLSRLDKDKGIELLIGACNKLGRRLVIAGTGRMEKHLKSIAGPTIAFLGRVPDAELSPLYANCRAFLFAADEDFGIVSVEAQSYGRPVIAFGHGGSLETVRVDDPEGRPDTGVFFPAQTVESVMDGIRHFESREHGFISESIQEHARRFDASVFKNQFRSFVDNAVAREFAQR